MLSGLKTYPVDLTAIVAMSDNGGSTGRLRDEYGVLPPGDLRQCLVALSETDGYMRELFNFRFDRGTLAGHSFGNILISTLEQVTGSFDRAVTAAADILKINGQVVPVTLADVQLQVTLGNGKVLDGESELTHYQLLSKFGVRRMELVPRPKANPRALAAIREADLIVVGPGNLYSSLVPTMLVPGIARALSRSRARKVYVCNLMNKYGQTDGFTVRDYLDTLEGFARMPGLFDTVLYNTKRPPARLLKRYVDEGEPVVLGDVSGMAGRTLVGKHILADTLYSRTRGDKLVRTLIRHDSDKMARALMSLRLRA